LQLAAHHEAHEAYQEGLALLAEASPSDERARLELDLLVGLGSVQSIILGNASVEVEQSFSRAWPISCQLGDSVQQFRILWNLWELHYQRGQFRRAQELAEAALQIAEENSDQAQRMLAHQGLGATLSRLGKMMPSHLHHMEAGKLKEDGQRHQYAYLYRYDPDVVLPVNHALTLWYLGYPDQARRRFEEGSSVAQSSGHPLNLVYAAIFGAALYQRANLPTQTAAYAEEAMRLSHDHNFALWMGVGTLYHGWSQVIAGNLAAGLAETRNGLAAIQKTGMQHIRYKAVLADVLRADRIDESLSLVDELLAAVRQNEESEWEAELYRLRGELLLAMHQSEQAEIFFEQAVAIAAAQQSRSLELRAALSLCRLHPDQGRGAKVRSRLAALYNWFQEGFDMPDLVEARRMLGEWHKLV
jgi:tetratricopeptide (TPR) repeat protein